MKSVHEQCLNSDSETVHRVQNWVGCTGAHPTDHGYAHGAPKLRALRPGRPHRGRVVACRVPYHRLVVVRVAGLADHVVGLAVSRVAGLAASRVAMPPRVSLRIVSQLLHRVVACYCAVSQRSAVVSRPKVAPFSHDTNLCIATLLPTKRTARRVARVPGCIARLLAL